MVSLLSGSIGLLVKSLAGLSCTQATRCSRLSAALSAFQHTTTRWYSKHQEHDGLPKRPRTAYIHFMIEQRPILMKLYPEAKLMEISKMAGLEWRRLTESAKQPYIELANEENFKYKDEVRKYKEQLSPLELQLLNKKRKERLVKRAHIRYKRELTILGKPKKSRTAFNIYLSENYQVAKGLTLMVQMKTLSAEWKVLPQSQKQIYLQLAQDDKIRYENEMKAWEEQMLEIGRADLLRRKTKIEKMHATKSKDGLHKKDVE